MWRQSDFPGSLCVVSCDGLWLPQDSYRPEDERNTVVHWPTKCQENCDVELESMLPDILSKKERVKKSETGRHLFLYCFSSPFYKASVLLHLLKPWHTSVRHSLFLTVWWIIAPYFWLSLLDPALTAQVTHYFTIALILLLVLFLLLFLLQLLEMSGKMNKLQKPQRYSCWVNSLCLAVLDPFLLRF